MPDSPSPSSQQSQSIQSYPGAKTPLRPVRLSRDHSTGLNEFKPPEQSQLSSSTSMAPLASNLQERRGHSWPHTRDLPDKSCTNRARLHDSCLDFAWWPLRWERPKCAAPAHIYPPMFSPVGGMVQSWQSFACAAFAVALSWAGTRMRSAVAAAQTIPTTTHATVHISSLENCAQRSTWLPVGGKVTLSGHHLLILGLTSPWGPVMEGVDGLKPVVQCRGLEVAC